MSGTHDGRSSSSKRDDACSVAQVGWIAVAAALVLMLAVPINAQPQQTVVVVNCSLGAPELDDIPLQSFQTYLLEGCVASRRLAFFAQSAEALAFVTVVANGGTALPCMVIERGPSVIRNVTFVVRNVVAKRVCASPWIGILNNKDSEGKGNASLVHIVGTNSNIGSLSVAMHNVTILPTAQVNTTYMVFVDTRLSGALTNITVVADDCTVEASIAYYAIEMRASTVDGVVLRSNGSAWTLLGRGSGLYRVDASTRMTAVEATLTHVVGRATRPYLRGFGCATCDNIFLEASVFQFSSFVAKDVALHAAHVSWHHTSLRPLDVMSTHSWYFMWLTSDAPINYDRRAMNVSMRMLHCTIVGEAHGVVSAITVDRLSGLTDATLMIEHTQVNLTARGGTAPTTSTRTTTLVLMGHVESSMNVVVALSHVAASLTTQCGVTAPGVSSMQNQGSAQGVIIAATNGMLVTMRSVQLFATLRDGFMQPQNVTGNTALGDIGASLVGLYKQYPVTNLTVNIASSSVDALTGFGIVPSTAFFFYGMYLSTVAAVSLVGNCTACHIALRDTHVFLRGVAFHGSTRSSWVTLVCPPEPFVNALNITTLVAMFDVYHQVERCGFPLVPPEAAAFLPATWLVHANILLEGCSVRTFDAYVVEQPLDVVSLLVPGVNMTNVSFIATGSYLPAAVMRSSAGVPAGGTPSPAGPFAIVCVSDCVLSSSRFELERIGTTIGGDVASTTMGARLVSVFRFSFKANRMEGVDIVLRELYLGPVHTADHGQSPSTASAIALPAVVQAVSNAHIPTTVHVTNVSMRIARCVFTDAAYCFDTAVAFGARPTNAATRSEVLFGCNTRGGIALTADEVVVASTFLAPTPLYSTDVDVSLKCETPFRPLVPRTVAATAAGASMAAVAASALLPTYMGGPVGGIPALQSTLGALSMRQRCALHEARITANQADEDTVEDAEAEAPSSDPIDNPLQLRIESFPYALSYAGGAVVGNSILIGAIAVVGWSMSRLQRWAAEQLQHAPSASKRPAVVRTGRWRRLLRVAAKALRTAYPGMLLVPYTALLQPVTTATVVLIRGNSVNPATSAVGGIGTVIWLVAAPCAIAVILWRLPLLPRAARRRPVATRWAEELFRERCVYVLPPASVFATATSSDARAAARRYRLQFSPMFCGSRAGCHPIALVEIVFGMACGAVTGVVLAAPSSEACAANAWGLWALVGCNAALLCLYAVSHPFQVLFDNIQAIGVSCLSTASVVLAICNYEAAAAGVDLFLAVWTLVPVALDVLHAVRPKWMPGGYGYAQSAPMIAGGELPRGLDQKKKQRQRQGAGVQALRSIDDSANQGLDEVPRCHPDADAIALRLAALIELICEAGQAAPPNDR